MSQYLGQWFTLTESELHTSWMDFETFWSLRLAAAAAAKILTGKTLCKSSSTENNKKC